jgi:hypothetical protein
MSKRGERIARGDKDRARYLEKRLQLEITKNCALSEVTRANPEYVFTMIKFLDEVDSFWEKALNRTLEEWLEMCKSISDKEAA